MHEIVAQAKQHFEGALEHLVQELRSLRTGRANPALVEHVMVPAYNTNMRLQDLATISVPEARQLLIAPFDPANAGVISKAIEAANLNVTPIIEGALIRIKIPEMDASVREKMKKKAHEMCEACKVRIRHTRQESNKAIKTHKEKSLITEDELRVLEKEIQQLTDKFCERADETTKQKEKDINTI